MTYSDHNDYLKDIEKLNAKQYAPSECVFWFYDDMVQISTKEFLDEEYDGFRAKNLKDVENLPEWLHDDCCESTWFMPEGSSREDVIAELTALGFKYDSEFDEGELSEDEEDDSDDEEEETETDRLRSKQYSPEECIFWVWVSKDGVDRVLHISTPKLRELREDDNFGAHNLKDVHTLPDYLHSEDSEMSWSFDEDMETKDLVSEMKQLGFVHAPQHDEGDE